jgi:hypothetical protein
MNDALDPAAIVSQQEQALGIVVQATGHAKLRVLYIISQGLLVAIPAKLGQYLERLIQQYDTGHVV